MQELKFNEEKLKELFIGFKKETILENLSLSELFELIELSPIVQFAPGEYIIKQGEPGTSLFILISGRMEVIHNDKVIKVFDKRGEIVGEMSLITNEVRSASVRAVNQVICLSINSLYFSTIEVKHKSILYYVFSKVLADRLKSVTNELSEMKKENQMLENKLGANGDEPTSGEFGGIL